jgi:hypothetical protein
MDVLTVASEHFRDPLQACSGIVGESAQVIAILPAGSPTLNRYEALKGTGGDSVPSAAVP